MNASFLQWHFHLSNRQDRMHTRRRLGFAHADDLDAPRLNLMHLLFKENPCRFGSNRTVFVPELLLSMSALIPLCQCSSHGILDQKKGPFGPLVSCRQPQRPLLQQKLIASMQPPWARARAYAFSVWLAHRPCRRYCLELWCRMIVVCFGVAGRTP